MRHSTNGKPATAGTVNRLQKSDQLGSVIDNDNSEIARALQVRRLTRRAAISAAMAAILAPIAFGEVQR